MLCPHSLCLHLIYIVPLPTFYTFPAVARLQLHACQLRTFILRTDITPVQLVVTRYICCYTHIYVTRLHTHGCFARCTLFFVTHGSTHYTHHTHTGFTAHCAAATPHTRLHRTLIGCPSIPTPPRPTLTPPTGQLLAPPHTPGVPRCICPRWVSQDGTPHSPFPSLVHGEQAEVPPW